MTDVTLRATKGSPLTHTEMDNNQVATRSGRKNIIIGGNLDTNPWQRGTSFTAVGNNDYTADRFKWIQAGAGVVNILKANTAPSVAQAGFLTSNCLSVDVTTIDSSIAAGDIYAIRNSIEGYDWAQIAQNDFVISFWHKHTKTGTYCVSLVNSGSDRSYVAEYTQSVTDTWEKAEIKVTASPSAGTWVYDTGIGLKVGFVMASGTNFQTTADAWNTGNLHSTSNQVNALDSASNFCRFALIQVEEGIVATDFERRHYSEEGDLCRRYYIDSAHRIGGFPQLNSTSNLARESTIYFGRGMRATPTVTVNPNSGWVGTPTASSAVVDGCRIAGTADTATSGTWTTGFEADSEL